MNAITETHDGKTIIQNSAFVSEELARVGYAFGRFEIDPSAIRHWNALLTEWNWLGPDAYLEGSSIFRYRRYGQLTFTPGQRGLKLLSNSTYFQSADINSYAGGIARKFEPLRKKMVHNPVFEGLLRATFDVFRIDEKYRNREWWADVHVFRIIAEPGWASPPTPEGIHRDGFPFGAVILADRQNIRGGETKIYTLDEQLLTEATLTMSLDTLFAFDTRIKHYVTPVECEGGERGCRDVLIFGCHLPGTEYQQG